MTQNPLIAARQNSLETPQARNQAWWESLPMTYEDWDVRDRSTAREQIISQFLAGNPWLTCEYFNSFTGKSILEIGCGGGPASCLFARGGASVTAIDLTHAAVAITKRHVFNLPVTVSRMDAEHLGFSDGLFDHVFTWGVLHHTAQPEIAFAEMARVIKPGGSGLVMVYNRASLRYYMKGLIWLFLKGRLLKGDTLSTVQRFYTDGYFHRHYTPAELTWELRHAGLVVDRISITHMSKK